MTSSFDAYEVDLHGHRMVYRAAGSGPTVVLIHGMINSSRHWERVALKLAETHHVVAPDLIGHGDAATPRGDYALGAHAASIRDLLATIVGHSLGFMQTLRAVIDSRGQHVSANDRLYLLGDMQTLIVWGERDRTIPIEHGRRGAHDAIPNCRFETLPKAAHFPNIEDPDGLAAILADFLATTAPVQIHDHDWGAVLAQRARRRLRRVA